MPAPMIWLALGLVASGVTVPYSRVDPAKLGVTVITRGEQQAPNPERWVAAEGALDASGSRARPTNAWWTNFVLGAGPSEMESANGFAIPYIFWPAKRGISACMPFVLAQANQIENGFDSTITFVTLGAADVPTGHRVASSDPLSVTLEWGQGAADAAAAGFAHPRARRDASASAPVVRGSPYVTMEYLGATPVFDSPQMLDPQIGLTVDGEPQTCPGVFEGSKFEVVLVQSDETWTIWSSARVQVGCQTDGALLTAQAPFDGVWRAAVTNNCTLGRSAFHCRKAPPADAEPTRFGALLDQHARTYPVGADVDMKASGDSASLRIQWKTRQMPDDAYDAHDAHAAPARGAGGGGRGGRGGGARRTPQLLMAAMEHHRALGLCATAAPAGLARHSEVYARNINGAVSLVQSDEWLLPYALLPVGWHSTHGVADAQRGAVLDALRDDAEWEVPANYAIGAGDPYNAGKMLSRIGTLALIAEELGEAELARKVGRKLSRLVEVYSSGLAHNRFVYDSSWGGYISCGCLYDDCRPKGCNPNGAPPDTCHCEPAQAYCKNAGSAVCPTTTDPGLDFGNGYYNDHHFHWGYHLFAAAVAARLDPAWGEQNRERLLLYARDIANPSAQDAFFPQWRHKDWFMGFSWASGFALGGGAPYRNGRNQESTSESINAYLGLQLLGDALGDEGMRDWGRLALASEVVAAQTYWQIAPGSKVYPAILQPKTLMGIVWQNLAQYQTWFGGSPYMIHGIQMMPFSPASEFYLQPRWVNASYDLGNDDCDRSAGCARDGWSTLFVMQQAILNPFKAWERALELPDAAFSGEAPAGNGNSRAATLHWIASRPQMHTPGARARAGGSRAQGRVAPGLQPRAWPPQLACAALPRFGDETRGQPRAPPPPAQADGASPRSPPPHKRASGATHPPPHPPPLPPGWSNFLPPPHPPRAAPSGHGPRLGSAALAWAAAGGGLMFALLLLCVCAEAAAGALAAGAAAAPAAGGADGFATAGGRSERSARAGSLDSSLKVSLLASLTSRASDAELAAGSIRAALLGRSASRGGADDELAAAEAEAAPSGAPPHLATCRGRALLWLIATRHAMLVRWARARHSLSAIGAAAAAARDALAARLGPVWRARLERARTAACDAAGVVALGLGAAIGSARLHGGCAWAVASSSAAAAGAIGAARARGGWQALRAPSAEGQRARALALCALLVLLLIAIATLSAGAGAPRVSRSPPPGPPSPPPRYNSCPSGGLCDAHACGDNGVAQCCVGGSVCPGTVCAICSCVDCAGFG